MITVLNWRDKKLIEDGCGGVIHKVIDVDNSNLKSVEIAMCVFAPSEVGRLHYHETMEEIYFILEGEGEIELNGTWYAIKNEDAVAIPLKTTHRIRNASIEQPLRFLAINAPSWNSNDMIMVEK